MISNYSRYSVYCQVTVVYIDVDFLLSYCKLLVFSVASCFTDTFPMCVRGKVLSGCIGRVAVDSHMSVLWPYPSGWPHGYKD